MIAMKLIKLANRLRPLCEVDGKLICYSKYSLVSFNPNEMEKKTITKLTGNGIKKTLSNLRIFERLFRTEVKTACVVNNDCIIFSHNGCSYAYDMSKKSLSEEHHFRDGMSNPLHYTVIENVKGFENMVVYGEYFSNTTRNENVKIYGRNNLTRKWNELYSFPKGTVRHIHGIVADKNNGCLYILTGDSDSESGIWVAKNAFKEVSPLKVGSQNYRAVYAFVMANLLVYATDTPLKDNNIISIDLKNQKETILSAINGSCLTACGDEHDCFFSTAVEADERVTGIRSWINYKRGPGIKSNKAEILWYDQTKTVITSIIEGEKDIYPGKLLQNGHFHMVYSKRNKKLFVYPIALKRIDGNLYVVNLEESV